MTEKNTVNRRQFLRGMFATGTAMTIAGCSMFGGDGDESGNDGEEEPDDGDDQEDGDTNGTEQEMAANDSSENDQSEDEEMAGSEDGESEKEPSEEEADLGVGDTVEGQLTSDAPEDPQRSEPAVPYDIAIDEEQTVSITQESDEIDPYLVLTREDGTVVAENDDGGNSFDSRLILTLSPEETYTVWAGAFTATETGSFTVSVSEIDAQEYDERREISVGDSVTGLLRTDSPTDPVRGENAVPFTLEVSEEQTVEIRQNSSDIDSYLVLTDEDGELVAENDDYEGVDSRLLLTLSPDEVYTVWAGAWSFSEVGEFELSVSESETPERDGGGSISVGESVTGTITSDSERDPVRDQPAVPYTLTVSEEQEVEITQTSDGIDCYLVVTDENMTEVARNDDGGSGFNSQVTITASPDVTYTIWAGSWASETGSFTLSVEGT